MATVNTSVSLNADTVTQAQSLFADLGLDLSTAIEMFLRQSVREQRIPFEVSRKIPNAETVAAMREVEEMKAHPENYKGYASFQELLDEVLNDA